MSAAPAGAVVPAVHRMMDTRYQSDASPARGGEPSAKPATRGASRAEPRARKWAIARAPRTGEPPDADDLNVAKLIACSVTHFEQSSRPRLGARRELVATWPDKRRSDLARLPADHCAGASGYGSVRAGSRLSTVGRRRASASCSCGVRKSTASGGGYAASSMPSAASSSCHRARQAARVLSSDSWASTAVLPLNGHTGSGSAARQSLACTATNAARSAYEGDPGSHNRVRRLAPNTYPT